MKRQMILLTKGDRVLDCTGAPLFTVTAGPFPARARGYVVLHVQPAPGREHQFPNGQTSGYGRNEVEIEA